MHYTDRSAYLQITAYCELMKEGFVLKLETTAQLSVPALGN